jgi:hypothetical protein
MINAKKLIDAINEEWYAGLDETYPNWNGFKGRGEEARFLGIKFDTNNRDYKNLWKQYKFRVLKEWHNSKSTL